MPVSISTPRLVTPRLSIPRHVIRRQAAALPLRFARLRKVVADFLRIAFDTYRPEAHYMRGPGPACAAKARKAAK